VGYGTHNVDFVGFLRDVNKTVAVSPGLPNQIRSLARMWFLIRAITARDQRLSGVDENSKRHLFGECDQAPFLGERGDNEVEICYTPAATLQEVDRTDRHLRQR